MVDLQRCLYVLLAAPNLVRADVETDVSIVKRLFEAHHVRIRVSVRHLAPSWEQIFTLPFSTSLHASLEILAISASKLEPSCRGVAIAILLL